MNAESHLRGLLSLQRRMADEGHPISLEELCRDCPELLSELAQRVRAGENGMPSASQGNILSESEVSTYSAKNLPAPGVEGFEPIEESHASTGGYTPSPLQAGEDGLSTSQPRFLGRFRVESLLGQLH